ncbi:MAG: CDP-alcohol phosphatidyltransferase family protein [Alkalispirochaeta sp.]
MSAGGGRSEGAPTKRRDNRTVRKVRYTRWTWTISLLIVAVTAGALAGPISYGTSAVVLGVAGGVLLASLFAFAREGHPLPNAITALRGAAAVVLLLWSATGETGASADGSGTFRGVASALAAPRGNGEALLPTATLWTLFLVLALVEVSDFFDGRSARRFGTTGFGAVWDMENDAFFTFALSFTVWGFLGFPPFVLAIGLMRYLYFLIVRVQGDPPVHPAAYKLFAKSVAAILVVALIGAFVPVVPVKVRTVVLATALALQLISFGWDLVLHRRSRNGREGVVHGG